MVDNNTSVHDLYFVAQKKTTAKQMIVLLDSMGCSSLIIFTGIQITK